MDSGGVPIDIGGKSRLALDSKMSGVFTQEELTGVADGNSLGKCSHIFLL